ncbi:MAG TPA: tRNA pseudouridine(13) synthase TruD [Phycisphaerales bacterium]|nr:tRNA pseudouridine(13) synthase TruD [Phycisphaerales bacterium]
MTIRRVPGDFRVREVLRPHAGGAAHAVYELTKESLTTPEAVGKLARALSVRPGDCAYAGLKDKHAITVQSVSVRMGPKPMPDRVGEERWSAVRTGTRSEPLAARDIDRNAFEIVVRDLTTDGCAQMQSSAEALRSPKGLKTVNYFGEQRFGSARHGEGFATAHLVRGEFERALRLLIGTPHRKDSGVQRAFTRGLATAWGDWRRLAAELPRCPQRRSVELLAERAARGAGGLMAPEDFRDAFAVLPYMLQEMCVDAWQSWLWNCIVEVGLSADGSASLVQRVALPSPGAKYHGAWQAAADRVMADAGVSLIDLRIPGLRRPAFAEAERAVWVEAIDFDMSVPEPDDLAPPRGTKAPPRFKRTVKFSLPSGSYATVVLRAIGQ